MKRLRCFVFAVAAVMLLSACGGDFKGNMDVKVQNFSNINQDGDVVSLSDLKGKVWLANFIFTKCTTVCPPMTKNMSDLQDMLHEEGVKNVEFVSFTVDPKNDNPEALKKYISHYEADESNWNLVTGYDEAEIREFAENSFQALAVPDPNSNQFIHGTSFYLVNKEGTAVKSYDGNTEVPFQEIVKDVKQVSEQK